MTSLKPCVPYLPFIVHEFSELQQSESDFLEAGRGDVINMRKRKAQAQLLLSLKRFQATPNNAYRFEAVECIVQYLLSPSTERRAARRQCAKTVYVFYKKWHALKWIRINEF